MPIPVVFGVIRSEASVNKRLTGRSSLSISFPDERLMGEVVVIGALVIVALSPLLRRIYIERFWILGSATVMRLDGGIPANPGAMGAWVWAPVIEYSAAGQR